MTDSGNALGGGDARERTYSVLPGDLGTYLVTTATGTTYLFQLGRRTVTRTPGPDSAPGIHDRERILRSIEKCEVGAPGYWTMIAGDPLTDHLWQTTSPIISIADAPDQLDFVEMKPVSPDEIRRRFEEQRTRGADH